MQTIYYFRTLVKNSNGAAVGRKTIAECLGSAGYGTGDLVPVLSEIVADFQRPDENAGTAFDRLAGNPCFEVIEVNYGCMSHVDIREYRSEVIGQLQRKVA